MFDALKILNLNPTVPQDQMYDLLWEKFSEYPNVTIDIVEEDDDVVAYLYFENCDDARMALKENTYIAMFGYSCRAVPCYGKPSGKRPTMNENYSGDYFKDDQFPSDSFINFEDDELLSSVRHEPDLTRSPPRQHSDYRRRGFRNARGIRRGGRGQRGFNSFRGRARAGKPYRSRGRGRASASRKSRDNDEQESPRASPVTHGNSGQKPHLPSSAPTSETADAESEKNPNSTLYIGSMDPTVKVIDLQRLFTNFGFVLDVEVKQPSSTLCFAFVHFLTMDMAQLAKQEMAGKPIGRTIPKLGYGRTVESKCLWVGGIGPWTNEDMLHAEFSQFGSVEKVEWPRNRDYAFVQFTNVVDAIDARQVMNGSHHGDPPHCLRVCYATSAQMNSHINYKETFPVFPNRPRPENQPKKKKFTPYKAKPRLPVRRRSPPRSREREHTESHRRRRRSPARSRSRSPSRKSRSKTRSRKKERTSSPYARSISQSSSGHMSAISRTSSEGSGSPERNRQRKRQRRSSVSRSPVNKMLRNPSPPKLGRTDECPVVLHSEPQLLTGASGTAADAFPSAAVPAYVAPVDPVVYYPPVASAVFPPPMHIPPPDYFMPPAPVMPPFPQHLPQLVSYPAVLSENPQPVPAVCQPSVPPVQTNTYLPGSASSSAAADKGHQDKTPVKPLKKPDSIAAKFPKVWSGALVLRNAAFVVDFHLLSGSVLLVNSLLGSNVEPGSDADCPVLKIAQRLRLDQPEKLDELDRRLKKAGRTGCSVLLANATPAQVDDDANVVQQYPLSSLVSYLLQKQVAAIVSLPPGSSDAEKATGVLHAFPPCKYATDFLRREAPGLPANCPTEEELLVVLCEF